MIGYARILKYLDPFLMKRYLNLALLAGVCMLAYSMNGSRQLRLEDKQKGRILEPLVGFVSGFLGGSCTLSGPPIVMWGVLKGWKKIEMHAVWARFFFAIAIFSLINLSINGMYSSPTIVVSLLLIPAVFAGFRIGTWVRDRITEKRFRLYVLAFLFQSGITGFALSFT
ncbi:MAG: sulfite exporter TauE/SafE family protein [Pseudomonadota bacterium]